MLRRLLAGLLCSLLDHPMEAIILPDDINDPTHGHLVAWACQCGKEIEYVEVSP